MVCIIYSETNEEWEIGLQKNSRSYAEMSRMYPVNKIIFVDNTNTLKYPFAAQLYKGTQC
jgi:hypothetical protein